MGSSFSFGLPVLAGVPVVDSCVIKFTPRIWRLNRNPSKKVTNHRGVSGKLRKPARSKT